MKSVLLCTLFQSVSLLVVGLSPCSSVQVRTDRPRMLIPPGGVAALRVKCQGPGKAMFTALKARADEMLKTPARLDNQGRFYLPTYALLYVITGEGRYANKAKEWLDLMSRQTIQDSWMCLEYVPTGAAAYDWVYAELSENEKVRFAEGLIRQVNRLKKLWRHSDYNNHFLLEHVSELHVALTLADEPHHQAVWRRWLAESEDWLKNHVIPAATEMAGKDGGHAEGFSYANWGYERPLALHLLAWKTATGEDLFPRCTMLRGAAIWNLYGRRPEGTMCRSEDCPSGHRWSQGAKRTFAICAAQYDDPYAQWAHDQIAFKYPQAIWGHLLAWDPSVPARSPGDLPLARLFRPLGHVYTRSGWDEQATWAMFQCGDFFAGHQHLDNNSFVLYKRGSLAIDSGVNEYSSHRTNYYSRSVAHNTVLVYDPEETFPDQVWSSQGTGGANDGGQRRFGFPVRVTASAAEKVKRDVGEIIAFQNTSRFMYAVGEATRSYARTKMRRFVRHFLHLRPDTFVVFDVVESTRAEFKKTWLLHSLERPRLESGHAVIRHDGGRLDVWTLLPEKAVVTLVGGPGKEFWVDGRNYPPHSHKDPEAGAWRMEVCPPTAEKFDVFLHLLHASAGGGPLPTRIAAIRQGDRLVTRFSLGPEQVEVRFNATGAPGGRVTIRRGGKTAVDRPLPESVVPNSTPR